jgi:alkanesulfonate monooxygenase SsuD/methylene tetrahydromethanopterin reductase-like flavin-dependent oxidoreductase (luciferase family)
VAVPCLEIGTLVSANTLRPAAVTGAMAATLARIGPGRFVLGLGAGGSREDHDPFGIPFPSFTARVSALDHACGLIRSVLRSTAGAEGTPLLIGGGSQAVLRLVARHADRCVLWATPQEAADLRGRLVEECSAVGRDPAVIDCGAIVMLRPAHLRQRFSQEGWPTLDGSAAAMRDQVEAYRLSGFERVIVSEYTLAEEDQAAALDWFACDVMTPYVANLRRATGASHATAEVRRS